MTVMRFFVYGAMTDGFVHFEKIRNFIEHQENAGALGRAFRLKVGFPVLIEGGCNLIPGNLIEIKETISADFLLAMMDEFHGYNRHDDSKSLHFRKKIQVFLNLGSGENITQEAWCYFINPSKIPKDAIEIEDGNWFRSIQIDPPLTTKLSDRQKTYVQRLGSSSGREIIPIDLPMYRELMNLELIVDKGRRLALSKLGREVYRFLD